MYIRKSNLVLLSGVIMLVCLVNAEYGMPTPPIKPAKFTSKQQLKEYWEKLNEYFNIINRPRWGRSGSLPEASAEQEGEIVSGEQHQQQTDRTHLKALLRLTNLDRHVTKEDFLKYF